MDIDPELEIGLLLAALLELVPFLDDLTELALDLHAHGQRALEFAAAAAVLAVSVGGIANALGLALARHLHQAKVGDRQHVRLGLVFPQAIAYAVEHITPIPR